MIFTEQAGRLRDNATIMNGWCVSRKILPFRCAAARVEWLHRMRLQGRGLYDVTVSLTGHGSEMFQLVTEYWKIKNIFWVREVRLMIRLRSPLFSSPLSLKICLRFSLFDSGGRRHCLQFIWLSALPMGTLARWTCLGARMYAAYRIDKHSTNRNHWQTGVKRARKLLHGSVRKANECLRYPIISVNVILSV